MNSDPTPTELRDASRTMIAQLTAERDALRAAMEEVCRCAVCLGKKKVMRWRQAPLGCAGNYEMTCYACAGTGRDYHGSELAQQLLEAKP